MNKFISSPYCRTALWSLGLLEFPSLTILHSRDDHTNWDRELFAPSSPGTGGVRGSNRIWIFELYQFFLMYQLLSQTFILSWTYYPLMYLRIALISHHLWSGIILLSQRCSSLFSYKLCMLLWTILSISPKALLQVLFLKGSNDLSRPILSQIPHSLLKVGPIFLRILVLVLKVQVKDEAPRSRILTCWMRLLTCHKLVQ